MSIIPSYSRLSQWQPGVVAIVCECGKRQVHKIENLRGFPPTTPTDALLDILTAYCRRTRTEGPCLAEFVSPDDGVAMEG